MFSNSLNECVRAAICAKLLSMRDSAQDNASKHGSLGDRVAHFVHGMMHDDDDDNDNDDDDVDLSHSAASSVTGKEALAKSPLLRLLTGAHTHARPSRTDYLPSRRIFFDGRMVSVL
jgi:hypothetical protein